MLCPQILTYRVCAIQTLHLAYFLWLAAVIIINNICVSL